MAKNPKRQEDNPLHSLNIPPPPAATWEEAHPAEIAPPQTREETENGITVELEKGSTVQRQNGITVENAHGPTEEQQTVQTVERQKGITAERQTVLEVAEEEKATIELSLYLKPSQDDKLDELQQAYKKRTGKRIHRNDILRKLIEKASIEDLF